MSGVLESDSMDSLDVSALMLSNEEDDIHQEDGAREKEQGGDELPIFLDGKFFKFIPQKSDLKSKKAVAECIKCIPNKIEIKGSLTVSSNFITHLKRNHTPNDVKEYTDYISANKRRKVVSHKTSRQSSHVKVTQQLFDLKLAKFIASSMIPFRVVEDPFFKEFMDLFNISALGLHITNRRSLVTQFNNLYDKLNSIIREKIRKVDFLCTTADIWSAKRRSFLGVTCHWINDSLERESVTLACRRFRSPHTYNRIAELLNEINHDFNVDTNKIKATITDNGSNFLKAFREYGVKEKSIEKAVDVGEELVNLVTDYQDDVPNSSYNECTSGDDEDILMPTNNEDIDHLLPNYLPKHLKCAAHTISLCITTDVSKFMKRSKEFEQLHTKVIGKCNSLWKLTNRPKSAEIIDSVLHCSLHRPGETRWNSLYDSIKQICKHKEKIKSLCKSLGMKRIFLPSDFTYLEEHITCTRPLAEALDILQGDKNTFYGILLPCLLAARKKLKKLTQEEPPLTYCRPLAECLLTSFENRFETFLNLTTPESETAAIAALSYPVFKKKWIICIPAEKHEKILRAFKTVVGEQMKLLTASQSSQSEQSCSTFNNYFDFGSPSIDEEAETTLLDAELHVLQYFKDPSQDLLLLDRYPSIKKVFIEYNTPLPSSAAVERMFSYATMTNLPKSSNLSDQMFEKRVFIKTNVKLEDN